MSRVGIPFFMWYNQGMVVTVFYKDGCVYAEDCSSFKLDKTVFLLNGAGNELDDSIDKISINGDVVYYCRKSTENAMVQL